MTLWSICMGKVGARVHRGHYQFLVINSGGCWYYIFNDAYQNIYYEWQAEAMVRGSGHVWQITAWT